MHPIKDATIGSGAGLEDIDISIHAPYKGCNANPIRRGETMSISIHAPYKGCNFI